MNDLTPMVASQTALSSIGFSYDALEPDQAAIVRAATDGIRSIHKQAIPAIGRHLLAAKKALPHGTFTQWAEQELGIAARSARNYMQLAGWLMGKPATVAVLPPTVLYALSAPGVPDDLVQSVLVEASSGIPLNPVAIQTKLTASKAEQVELKVAQRQHPGLSASELRVKREQKQRREDAKRVRENTQREADKRERVVRLAPVVDDILAAVGPAVFKIMIGAFEDWEDRYVFLDLLRAAARDGEPT